ncbi:MAG: hypothetical protein ACTSQJ_18635 [Promethearchaeota archaeon]
MSLLPFGFVAIKEDVYLSIAKTVLTYANPYKMKKEEFREVYGFLGGRIVVGNCKINEVQVAHIGDNMEVQLEPKHYIAAADWESQLYIKDPPEFMVGWWHSHFIGHTFSGIDIINHLGWQNENNPHAIGLVFDPQLISKENPGFVILKLEDFNKGEASEVHSIDFVIQMKENYRENYLNYLKEKLPQFFK